jgi:3-deoxy-D-manno-octulosonic-acid transferase
LIIAPHEPTASHLAPIERWAAQSAFSCARLAQADVRTDVVIVDTVGVLGQLYALADVAFVGGGFHAAGLHSVIEPAAFGAPVLFGPGHDMSREAGLLIAAGGGIVVADTAEATANLLQLLLDADARRLAGRRARDLVELERGAVGRTVDLLRAGGL